MVIIVLVSLNKSQVEMAHDMNLAASRSRTLSFGGTALSLGTGTGTLAGSSGLRSSVGSSTRAG